MQYVTVSKVWIRGSIVLARNTFERKPISVNPSPNLNPNPISNPKAQ